MTEPKYGVLAGEPGIIGERCMDGGTCHYRCQDACFRKECCSPLGGAGLNDDWSIPGQELKPKQPEYVLYGYATPSGKLYASGMEAVQAGEQRFVKVYVNKEDI